MAAAVMVLGSAIGPGLTGALLDFGVGLETQYLGVAAYFALVTATLIFGVGKLRRSNPQLA
jgi:hypothetical protein